MTTMNTEDRPTGTVSPITQSVMAQGDYSVAGIVVHCQEASQKAVVTRVNALEGVEVHAAEGGKLVVTVEESEGEKRLIDRIADINNLEGVINTALVYSETDLPD